MTSSRSGLPVLPGAAGWAAKSEASWPAGREEEPSAGAWEGEEEPPSEGAGPKGSGPMREGDEAPPGDAGVPSLPGAPSSARCSARGKADASVIRTRVPARTFSAVARFNAQPPQASPP